MPEFTCKELRSARVSAGMAQWELGNCVGVSEGTIKRWESGESKPTPDDVDRIGEIVGDASLWHRWMISNCDSYRRRYKNAPDYSLPAAVMHLGHMLDDIAAVQDSAERDAVDGRMEAADAYVASLKELIARCTGAMQKINEQEGKEAGR